MNVVAICILCFLLSSSIIKIKTESSTWRSDRVLIMCQSDSKGFNTTVQYCCQMESYGSIECVNDQPFQSKQALAVIPFDHGFIVIGTDGKPPDSRHYTGKVNIGHYQLTNGTLDFNPLKLENNSLVHLNASLVYKAVPLSPTSNITNALKPTKAILIGRNKHNLNDDVVTVTHITVTHGTSLSLSATPVQWKYNITFQMGTTYLFIEHVPARYECDGDSFIAVGGVKNGTLLTITFASVVFTDEDETLMVCGGRRTSGPTSGELLKSCELIDFKPYDPTIKYYEEAFGPTGKSNALIVHMHYTDYTRKQLISFGYLEQTPNSMYQTNREIRPYIWTDSEQRWGDPIGTMNPECYSPLAIKIDSHEDRSSVNLEWKCAPDYAGTGNNVQYCSQKKENGTLECDITNPFTDLRLRLGSALLDGGKVYVFGTDGKPPDSSGTGTAYIGRYSVIAGRLNFEELGGADALNSSLVYTNVVLIPANRRAELSKTSVRGILRAKVLLIGIDEWGGRQTNLTLFAPSNGSNQQNFRPIPGKYDQWLQEGTTYVILKGMSFKDITGQECLSKTEEAAQSEYYPFMAIGGRTNGSSLTLFSWNDDDNIFCNFTLGTLKDSREFASAVWHESEKRLIICGGQKPGTNYAGELIASCEEIDFENNPHEKPKYYKDAFGPDGKSQAGLIYMKVNRVARTEHLMNFGYKEQGCAQQNLFKYNREIKTFEWTDSTQKFGAVQGHLITECKGLMAIRMDD